MRAAVVTICRDEFSVVPQTLDSLREFSAATGIPHHIEPSCTLLEEARSIAMERAFDAGLDVLIMWDADIVAGDPSAVRRMAELAHEQAAVAAAVFLRHDGTTALEAADGPLGAGPVPVRWIGGGLMAIPRAARDALRERLPEFADASGRSYREYFGRLKAQRPDGRFARLSEIYSLCERCHEAGIAVLADPRVETGHVSRDRANTLWWRQRRAA